MLKRMIITLSIFLGACSTSTGPVVIRDAGVGSDSENKAGLPVVVKPQQEKKASDEKASPLKTNLLKNARAKLQEGDTASAIALAERGLRIDRKEPGFYLVLSQAYAQVGDLQQSAHFARQGLRYAPVGSDSYQELLVLSQ